MSETLSTYCSCPYCDGTGSIERPKLEEIERLKLLLQDLIDKAEPFVELMETIRSCHPSFDRNPDNAAVDVFWGDDPSPMDHIYFGDLRSLSDSVRKAKDTVKLERGE